MRKMLALFIAIIWVVTINAQTKPNILINPDFESGIANWTQRNCTLESKSDLFQSGSKSILVSNRTKNFGGPAQLITDSLKAYGYGTYIISANYRAQTGTDTAKIQLQYTVSGEKLFAQVLAPINSNGWTKLIDTVTIDWNGKTLDEGNFYLQTKNDMTRNYYVDNVSMIPLKVEGGIKPNTKNPITKHPIDSPISPTDYRKMLKKGMDVGWAEFDSRNAAYNSDLVKLIAQGGFNHFRHRTGWAADATLFKALDKQIEDALDNGIIPIIANQGKDLEENPTEANQTAFIQWWKTISERYKNYTHKLAFNLIIEISGLLSDQPETLNSLYERVVSVIRETNPTRIIIISPVGTSDPYNLKLLKIPTKSNGYLMGEWHFYAAGPSKSSSTKLWTTGTAAEKKLVTDKINAALDWEKSTSIPTWVGAWMPGNYNKADEYTVPEQVVFSSFMVRELGKANIPWAVNAEHKFTDYLDGFSRWTQSRVPVRDVMIDPMKATLFTGELYGGTSVRVAVGTYNKEFLTSYNLLNNIKSFMLPADFTISLFTKDGLSGTERIYSMTDSSLVKRGDYQSIESIKIDYKDPATSINENFTELHSNFELMQNYPNPFNPSTVIKYVINTNSFVKLSIYDSTGKLINEFVNKEQVPGIYQVQWNSEDRRNFKVSSGIYFYCLSINGKIVTKKMALLK